MKMNCQKAQRMFGDLAEGRLPEAVAAKLQRHIQECTDCRVAQHRAARLQQLLGLKRHEMPGAAYFDNFLGEFHHRLETESTAHTHWWERLAHAIAIEPVRVWHYGLAGAVGAVMVGVALWYNSGTTSPVQPTASGSPSTLVTGPVLTPAPAMLLAQDTSTPSVVRLPVVEAAAFDQQPGGAIILPAAARAERSSPRYILDRIAVSPASYEDRYDF